MIDFNLTNEQELIKETAREFAKTQLLPGVIERDESQNFPTDEVKKLGELGFMGMMVPEKWGGSGLDTISYVIAIEEIAAIELATSTIMSVNNSLVCQVLMDWGNDMQKNQFLKPLARGMQLGAYSLSEPQSGSDASNLKTYAEKNGSHYIINGTKNWVTSGENSDIVIVFCRTNKKEGSKGISAFIIDKEASGFTVGKKENKLGLRASDTCELYFDNCKIPETNLLGDEGDGFSIAMKALGGGRIGIAAQSVGLARSSLESAIKYSKERQQFGKPICKFGAIQDKLANIATDIDAARLLVWKASSYKDQGKDYAKISSMAKLFASTTAMSSATESVQIHGGYGYMQEYGIERLMRDAKITEIYEGTSEIQRLVISRELLK
tara:strand:- start:307 stop:1449 length:1143 start_codon:yes stop_codon:yes gene_type:complete